MLKSRIEPVAGSPDSTRFEHRSGQAEKIPRCVRSRRNGLKRGDARQPVYQRKGMRLLFGAAIGRIPNNVRIQRFVLASIGRRVLDEVRLEPGNMTVQEIDGPALVMA